MTKQDKDGVSDEIDVTNVTRGVDMTGVTVPQ